MEMTRKEILNSSEYWQERAETQCYTEGIDCTIQLVDKQQFIDKACEWINNNADKYVSMHVGYDESETYPYVTDDLVKDFKQSIEGE